MKIDINSAIKEIQKGNFIIIKDDDYRENEGDLVISAKFIDSSKMNFMMKEARGLICAPIYLDTKKRLKLNLVKGNNKNN